MVDTTRDDVLTAMTLVAMHRAVQGGLDLDRHGALMVELVDAKGRAAFLKGIDAMALFRIAPGAPPVGLGSDDEARVKAFIAETQAAGDVLLGFNPPLIEMVARELKQQAKWLPPASGRSEAIQ